MTNSNNTFSLAQYQGGQMIQVAEFRVSPCGTEVDLSLTCVQSGDRNDNCFELEAGRDAYRALRSEGWVKA